jgi:hypothetical protein
MQGSTLTVTITGTNFTATNPAFAFSGTGITVSNISVQNATTATATVATAADATPGARTISVGGVNGTVTFTVVTATASLTSISPNTVLSGAATTVTLSGTSFVPGSTVSVSGTGVTVSDVAIASSTSMTARVTVAAAADIGVRSITVTTPAGTSSAQSLTINPTTPVITGATPSSALPGSTIDVTFRGTGFVPGATTVSVSGGGVTVLNVSIASAVDQIGARPDASGTMVAGNATTVIARLAIDPNAALGPRTVTVSTAGGTSPAFTFNISASFPAIGGFHANPIIIYRGSSSNLSWSGITNATSCNINVGIGTVPCANSGMPVSPTATTEYMLSAIGPGGREWAYATVVVEDPPVVTPPPVAVPSPATVTADNDSYAISEDVALVVTAATGVLNGDATTGATPLTAVLVSSTTRGALTLNANGSFSYTPNANVFGTDTFTYRATDGVNTSAAATVTITVSQLFDDSQVFAFTGAAQTFTVTSGISTTIRIEAFGAQGGGGGALFPGGTGGSVIATVAVTPGPLTILVGGVGGNSAVGGGAAGFNGGGAGGSGTIRGAGGGGASSVSAGGTDLVRAGGGGGSVTSSGGAGGGLVGADGAGFAGAGGGGGGNTTLDIGGAGGTRAGIGLGSGTSGAAEVGGAGGGGGDGGDGGAGGGGGWQGGGGGGAAFGGGAAAGGGGSSFAIGTATGVTHVQGGRTGPGQVTITW